MSTVAQYWNGTAWVPVDRPVGVTGATGPAGAAGTAARTSCGGCRFVGSQTAQPTGVIWDVDNFITSADSVDPNPCMYVSASNELGVLRNTSNTFIQITLRVTGGSITARSFVGIYINGSVGLGRQQIIQSDDAITVIGIAALGLTDKIRFQVYLNGSASFAYTADVTAALTP